MSARMRCNSARARSTAAASQGGGWTSLLSPPMLEREIMGAPLDVEI
jgi:hypothetical protein